MTTYRDHSKTDWISQKDTYPGIDAINAGSLQRIADATEAMAKNYTEMQRDLNWYKNYCKSLENDVQHLKNSRAAIKAHNTRLKNKLEAK